MTHVAYLYRISTFSELITDPILFVVLVRPDLHGNRPNPRPHFHPPRLHRGSTKGPRSRRSSLSPATNTSQHSLQNPCRGPHRQRRLSRRALHLRVCGQRPYRLGGADGARRSGRSEGRHGAVARRVFRVCCGMYALRQRGRGDPSCEWEWVWTFGVCLHGGSAEGLGDGSTYSIWVCFWMFQTLVFQTEIPFWFWLGGLRGVVDLLLTLLQGGSY